MKHILTGALCLLAVYGAPAWAEGARSWDIGGAHVTVEKVPPKPGTDEAEPSERLTVRRDGADAIVLEDYRFALREPKGENLTGGTTAQLAITGWSGGAHCCHTLHIVELGEKPRLLQSIDAGHSDIDLFAQMDDDPALEIALPDWSYAYWPGSFGGSPVPRVILHWDGQKYAPSAKLMRAGTMLYQMQERRQPQSEDEMVSAVFQDTLDMIYAGRWKAARTLLKQLLPPTPDNKRLEQEFFDCKLPSSPWWPFVAGLNNVPAKPPAATCKQGNG
jgi:hypothetical protein